MAKSNKPRNGGGGEIFKRRLFPRRRLFRYSTRYGQLSLHARQLGCYSPYRGKGGGTRVEIDSPRSFCGRTRVETRVDKELRLCCAGLTCSIDNFEKIIWKVKLFDHGICFLLEFDISVDMEGEF